MTDTNVWQASASEVTVTIKAGKGYEDSWYVFRGRPEEVKEQIISFFGIPSASVASLSPFEVAVNARQIAQGNESTVAALGGTIVQDKPSQPQSTPGDDPWASVGPQDAAPAENPMLAQIAATKDVQELQRLWAENQAAFADPVVMDAWKARGKALQAAAA